MRTLKLIEKILFIVAVALATAALALGKLLDATYLNAGYHSLATAIAPYAGMFGLIGGIAILLACAFVRYSTSKNLARAADAIVLAFFIIILVTAVTTTGGLTIIFGLISAIVYAVSALIRAIIAIVERVKPVANVDYDPDNDEKIRNIIKWKGLLDKGIITKDEFAAKRAAILAINEEEDYE